MKITNGTDIESITNGSQTIGWLKHSEIGEKLNVELAAKLTDGANVDDSWASYECHDDYDIFFLNIPHEQTACRI